MAKRFTDTDKWKKPFIRSLKAPYKLLWFYIVDDCDTAGIWEADFDVAQVKIGEKIDPKTAIKQLGKNIIEIDNGNKWFIPSFIEFQYPNGLSYTNKAHAGAIRNLQKFGLIDENLKLLTSSLQAPSQAPQEKDMDMVTEKVMEKDKEKEGKILEKNEIEILEKLFENFRSEYPGRKNGLEVEFKNFKRHHDWKDCIPSLMPSLEAEIEWRAKKLETGFVPQWKNLSTWINQRCWEQELDEVKIIRTKQELAQNSGVANNSITKAEQRRQELGVKS